MKLIILDRDGVINYDSDDYIKTVAEWIPIEGAIDAIARLSKAGWTVAVATNQSGIARGYYNVATLEAMHNKLRALVTEAGGELGMIAYCPHGPNDGCDCRKPKPGLLQQISEYYQVPLQEVWFVGDSASDLKAAQAVACQQVLVRTGKGLRTLEKGIDKQVLVFDDLVAVADYLLQ
ncbi:D-glycero-beta-D-manno-heptose 1,7-bisphosphate 7-phosphatase [Entomomonas asaccharolytica]|uniref:D,D-heptose 1,7-bisphosphate phosphatase n=1 Tax=Entomomonas asaccharolytica TaxID=2785331 RepID=A0A974NEY8_9GAMM|nr:D-glycero-beta-D-manno-heptose 1,7-bisphosphate 7-phosphatase [Entomomonas asaccharolytica]QQP85313.1 D-glycero-beta-D-manno-heptose 1,7-bisphosphate 7-phosphatase [Entomomonas asaccharolytica]